MLLLYISFVREKLQKKKTNDCSESSLTVNKGVHKIRIHIMLKL